MRVYRWVLNGWVAMLAGGTLLACAPTLDWRTVEVPQGDGLQALFPCKPESVVRSQGWPEVPGGVQVSVLSCQAGEQTWALQYTTLPDAALVPAGMREWRQVMARNLGQAARQAGQPDGVAMQDLGPVRVPRMTPSDEARAWRWRGSRPDGWGRPMALDILTWHFSHGTTVFQASVWRPAQPVPAQTDEDMAQEFFQGFQFRE